MWDLVPGGNWCWIAAKLYNGINLMGGYNKRQSYAAVEHNGKIYKEGIRISGLFDDFYLGNLALPLSLFPLTTEKIFRPKIGMKYSEQPLMVFCGGKEVGYGIREKTYGGKMVDESKIINSELIRS